MLYNKVKWENRPNPLEKLELEQSERMLLWEGKGREGT